MVSLDFPPRRLDVGSLWQRDVRIVQMRIEAEEIIQFGWVEFSHFHIRNHRGQIAAFNTRP
jgi:hypothetical protein